jgi:hypothetical protein
MKPRSHPVVADERLERTQKTAGAEKKKLVGTQTGLGALLARQTVAGLLIDGPHRAKPVRRRRPRVPGA